MNITDLTGIFTILQTQLWTNVQGLALIAVVIAGLSSGLVEAIKNADESVFRKRQASNLMMWVLNIVFTGVISLLVVVLLGVKDTILQISLYILLTWIFSWVLSVPIYYLLKFSKHIYVIISLKFKNVIEQEELDLLTIRSKKTDLEKKKVLTDIAKELDSK